MLTAENYQRTGKQHTAYSRYPAHISCREAWSLLSADSGQDPRCATHGQEFACCREGAPDAHNTRPWSWIV